MRKTRVRRNRPCVELLEDRLAPATFLVTNINDMGAGSLRQAILSANTAAGADTINFNIQVPTGGPATIALASALPTLTGPVTIAGNTQPGAQPGAPVVELDGARAGAGANGLVLKAAGCVVRGLIIDRFGGNGILALGANAAVQGCFIGISTADTKAGNGYHGVLIAGTATGVSIGGPTVAARNVISGNGLYGVAILGGTTAGNHVSGNLIGTDLTGTLALGNSLGGVQIGGGSKNNVIGGSAAGAGNVISGNGGDGVDISGTGTTGNQVQGNFIGTNKNGTGALLNAGNGVAISGGSSRNMVGSSAAGAGNVISGNGFDGVDISDTGTTGNVVQGNFIGTDATGAAALGNGFGGVFIGAGAASNMVGGSVAGDRNVISGNDFDGITIDGRGTTGNVVQGNFIGTNKNGTAKLANGKVGVVIADGAANNMVGGSVAGDRNVISGNADNGILIEKTGTTGNVVQGNFIGTDATGAAALGNGKVGVDISFGGTNTMVGGSAAGARNVISGNGGDGVIITDTTGNQVQGNFIGTDATGAAALGNGADGVVLEDVNGKNTVGGSAPGTGNVISGNTGNGVVLDGATGSVVQGNLIGTNAKGTAAMSNNQNGVLIETDTDSAINSANTMVGGSATGARNVISGNDIEGVAIRGSGTGNVVQGNFIGTNAAGTAALANGFDGVFIGNGATNTTVGGSAVGTRNVISGNGTNGVEIASDGTTGNQVQGNFIGLAADGITALGNTRNGVFVTAAAANNIIGGTAAGVGNRIAHNGGTGVLIGSDPQLGFTTPAGSGNSVEGNSIFANNGQGIDLGPSDGPTPNDPNDADSGPNDLLNTPVLTSATLSGTSLFLTGFINTEFGETFRIEFFASASGGQGQTFLGFQNVITQPQNTVLFTTTLSFPAALLTEQTLTATATDASGNTSEFSLPLSIV